MFIELDGRGTQESSYFINLNKIIFIDIDNKGIAVESVNGRLYLADGSFNRLINILKETNQIC